MPGWKHALLPYHPGCRRGAREVLAALNINLKSDRTKACNYRPFGRSVGLAVAAYSTKCGVLIESPARDIHIPRHNLIQPFADHVILSVRRVLRSITCASIGGTGQPVRHDQRHAADRDQRFANPPVVTLVTVE